MTSIPPPVVDFGPSRSDPDGAAAAATVEVVDAACLDTGFFVVTGHGIEAEVDRVFDAARDFFALPQATKERTPKVDGYGYVPHRDQALDPARASDRTEFLDLGLADEVPLPGAPGFADAVRAYQAAALDVADVVLRTLARALGIDAGFFAERMRRPQCKLRMLHYFPSTAEPGGALPVPTAPHTDYGAITLLATDGVPGLEVLPRDRDWTPVAAPAGSLVVNLGDLLARWTGDRYRSTPHRVVGPVDRHRISVPFFVNPDPSVVVETIPECLAAGATPTYLPVTAGEFLAARIAGDDEPYVDPTSGPVRRAD